MILNFIFIPAFGHIAAGYTTLICYILYALMHWFFMRRTLKKHIGGIAVYDTLFIAKLSIIFVAVAICKKKETYGTAKECENTIIKLRSCVSNRSGICS